MRMSYPNGIAAIRVLLAWLSAMRRLLVLLGLGALGVWAWGTWATYPRGGAPPSWQGIVPGQTTEAGVREILGPPGSIVGEMRKPGNGYLKYVIIQWIEKLQLNNQ